MRSLILISVLLAPLPAMAEDKAEGRSLMEEGLSLFFEGLRQEAEPAIEGFAALGPQMREFWLEMGPALAGIMEQVDDWSLYHLPEVLENGDIIIRRKTPGDAPQPEQDEGAVDL